MKWDLTYLYANDADWQSAYEQASKLITQLGSFKGKLGDSKAFKQYFLLQKEFEKVGLRVYQYASLKSDLNKKDTQNAAMLQKAQIAFHQLREAVSFEEPELIGLGKEVVLANCDNDLELAEFRFAFEKLFRRQEHILDDDKEALLANFSQITNSGRD